MLEFIQLLKQRYQTVIAELDRKNPILGDYRVRADQLLYAEAFIRKGMLISQMPAFPLQVAVIGPTQAGKSSVVNLLLNSGLAGVSPLAGYTVHPHGFCHGLSSDDCLGLQQYFGRFQCLEEKMLSRNRFDCYSLANCPSSSPLLPTCVCWDTPDFDSIDADDYREGVIRTVALADVVVLVLSKEKYADQSVWEVMKLIEAFQQPTLICVNKLVEGTESLVLQSLEQKWRQHRKDPVPKLVPLLFEKQGGMPSWPSDAQFAIFDLADRVAHNKHPIYQQQLLNGYWRQWLEPVYAEHQAKRHWENMVDQCLSQALKMYQRDYLDHPHHYETFQNALLKLLKLLEIPGIAKVISKTRRVMTWPVRKLFDFGGSAARLNAGQEVAILCQIGEHVMIQLADKLLEKAETESLPLAWWKDSAAALRQKRPGLLETYRRAVEAYHHNFRQDIDAAADRLYYKLQEQPATLNSLRATRVTTDAAAMLLAIQAGGIGIHDLVLTPMMLTVTSLLAESAIGGYMHRVEAELKQHQLMTVKTALFETCLKQRLYDLPQLSPSRNRFNITEQLLSEAEHALKEKKHGLRVL